MCKHICATIFSFFLAFHAFALPDLTVTSLTLNKPTIAKGDYLIVTANIKNIGNQTADASFSAVSIGSLKTARIATKSLSVNEATVLQFVFPIPSSAIGGQYPITVTLDIGQKIVETNENNQFCPGTGSCQSLTVTSGTYMVDRKLPCPIIFIHGLQSQDQTWFPFADYLAKEYGLSTGGYFNYCLNPDGNNATADSRAAIQGLGSFPSRLPARNGDFYFVNFDVSTNGTPYVSLQSNAANSALSNQSAIHKQAFALQAIVKRVLEVTGAKEVVLMGHSMGGLAARQYIQDSTNWQSDGKHHVAKLVTVGTPHGGSNTAGGVLTQWFKGIDEKSEAVRDLRYPTFSARFLFGGSESGITEGYYNRDVNCNGSTSDNIKGLTQRTFPSDISVACVIGTGIQSLCTYSSDVVVCDDRADFNQFSNAFADKFLIPSNENVFFVAKDRAMHTNLHTNLLNNPALVQSLDEPKTYDKAYDIPTNMAYFGTITIQAENDPFTGVQKITDYDDYRFTLPVRSTVQVLAANIAVRNFNLYLLNANEQVIYTLPSGGGSNINSTVTLDAGTYYLEVEATPDDASWQYPYMVGTLATPIAGTIAAFTTTARQGCSPMSVTFGNQSTGATSYQWTFQGGVPSTSTEANPTVFYATNGVYDVTLTTRNATSSNTLTRSGYVSVGRAPIASFSYSNIITPSVLTVGFFNTSVIGVDANYLWDFGDGTTSIEASPVHTYATYGSKTVTLTVTNACGTKTISQTIGLRTPTAEPSVLLPQFGIAPNPNDGRFTVTLQAADLGEFQLTIYNALGQPAYTTRITEQTSPLSMDIPNGTYIAVLTNDDGSSYRTFVVQK